MRCRFRVNTTLSSSTMNCRMSTPISSSTSLAAHSASVSLASIFPLGNPNDLLLFPHPRTIKHLSIVGFNSTAPHVGIANLYALNFSKLFSNPGIRDLSVSTLLIIPLANSL